MAFFQSALVCLVKKRGCPLVVFTGICPPKNSCSQRQMYLECKLCRKRLSSSVLWGTAVPKGWCVWVKLCTRTLPFLMFLLCLQEPVHPGTAVLEGCCVRVQAFWYGGGWVWKALHASPFSLPLWRWACLSSWLDQKSFRFWQVNDRTHSVNWCFDCRLKYIADWRI